MPKKAIFAYDNQRETMKKNIRKIDSVSDFTSYYNLPVRNPLIDVVDYGKISPVRHSLNNYGVFGVFFHTNLSVDISYGCGKYDYHAGTLICVAPGQIGGKEDNGEHIMLDGWALVFHPDLLRGTHLEKAIKNYKFFDYRVNEALHTTDEERKTLCAIVEHIKEELANPHDSVQKGIVVSYVELLLNYCQRFYNRQFITRELENTDILVRFNALLQKYYDDGSRARNGIPSVQECAGELCLSPNYFGDLIRKTTGDTASNYIRRYVVELAKNKLAAGKSVAETAYELGFEYTQHFSRLFKNYAGMSPSVYVAALRGKTASES